MRCLFAVLLAFLVLSCKKENTTVKHGSIYPEEAIGTVQNGTTSIANTEELAKSWTKSVETPVTAFEIIKGMTEGDKKEEFYMLVARTEDGSAKIASLLELKDGKFYLSSQGHENSEPYILVICKGDCEGGCLPIAKIKDGVKRLVCSSCADCEKNEKEVR